MARVHHAYPVYRTHEASARPMLVVLVGSGYFDVRAKDERWVRIKMGKGDMITLPAGMYHRFTLDDANYIKVRGGTTPTRLGCKLVMGVSLDVALCVTECAIEAHRVTEEYTCVVDQIDGVELALMWPKGKEEKRTERELGGANTTGGEPPSYHGKMHTYGLLQRTGHG